MLISSAAFAQAETGNQNGGKVEPPDVYKAVMDLQADLELIRLEMGRPKENRKEISVTGAEPYAVYFQALTLFDKSGRLKFENTREIEREAPPRPKNREIRPNDVRQLINLASVQLRRVKVKLNINETESPAQRIETKTLSDVFAAIVQANRQLNLMLSEPYAPSDVFEQVTFGISYASSLLAHFPDATRIPAEPAYERRKTPADVDGRLRECLQEIEAIAAASNLEMLELGEPTVDELAIMSPSDVYDLAALAVAELAHIQLQLPNAREPRQSYGVGRKMPSDVYQRAGILLAQLKELRKRVESTPNWLKANGSPPAS
ncbi:MAG: hypothetical protein AAF585_01815 [Verrucomicrobiota bacterium]